MTQAPSISSTGLRDPVTSFPGQTPDEMIPAGDANEKGAAVVFQPGHNLDTLETGEAMGIVPTMIRAASQARIEVNPLRRNISVLEGSGGNIAVLTGKDGKLLIDAGFTVSRDSGLCTWQHAGLQA